MTAITGLDSDAWDGYEIIEESQVSPSLESLTKDAEEFSRKLAIAWAEDRYADMLVVLDEVVVALKQIKNLCLDELPPQAQEGFKTLQEYLPYIVQGIKSYLFILMDEPQEAIEHCTQLIGMLEALKAKEEKDSYAATAVQLTPIVYYLRSMAFFLDGKPELATSDYKSCMQMSEELDLDDEDDEDVEDGFDIDHTILSQLLERKFGVSLYEKKEISESEFEAMTIDQRIEFCLENGEPKRALEMIDASELENAAEMRAIAYGLMGDTAAAAMCLRGHDLSEMDTNEALLYLLQGDFAKAKAVAKENFGIEYLPVIHVLEPKADLSLMSCKA